MRPSNETELTQMVSAAAGPLVVRGGGTRAVGRPITGDVIETGALSGVRLYEPGALTLVVGAGTPLDEVEAVLAGENQRLPFEPGDWRALLGSEGTPTIGGVVAANVSGPRRIQAGACRDSLIGVRFVDGAGNLVANGGRVMKNVTGYDLVKLMAGSWGTLGIISELSFKLLPVPETSLSVLIPGLRDAGAAAAAMARALRSPYDVSGAAWSPTTGVALRVEGFAGSVRYRGERLAALLADAGTVEIDSAAESNARRWHDLRDVSAFAGRAGDVWRLSVKPGDAPALVARCEAEAVVLDWGGGLIWALMPEGTDLRARLGAFDGHATLIRGSAATRAAIAPFQPEPGPVAALSQGLRARFDPRAILNPGLMQ